MTTEGNNQKAVSQSLTETAICPGQIQEGMILELLQYYQPYTRDELMRYLDYQLIMATRRKGDPFLSDNDHSWEDYQYLQRIRLEWLENELAKSKKNKPKGHAGHDLGAREFTLTYSPKWMDDSAAQVEMAKAIEKLCKYYADDIIELRAVGEVGSNGLSHIHCFYKLQGGLKMTDKNFKRAWKYWNPKKKIGHGFEGGHHQTVKEESDFRGYIDKDVDTAWFEKNVKNE